ncbi:MAG: hypothetical protein L0241_22410 [Planctomycetia bacterium]|nr:hypothetical protein [Planctomycetia bacterium]
MFSLKRLLFLVPVLLCGCAHGFNRDALRERLNDPSLQSPDAAIAEARGLKPQLQLPCRIAVYLKPSNDRDWRWTPEDKAALEKWAATLKEEGIATEVFPLPEMLAGKGEVKELRLAAAQCGADVLFVIHGASQVDSYKNFASAFNLTVVGGYVVPGSHVDALFMMEGLLLDVDNGYIYTGVQTEGVGKIMRPTFVIEEKDAVAQAKGKAVADFGDEVVKRMRTLAITPFISDVNHPRPNVPTDANGFEIPTEAQRPARVSDVPAIRPTPGLTPAGTFAPDLNVPVRQP